MNEIQQLRVERDYFATQLQLLRASLKISADWRWTAVDEVGNDNFATSIYENDHKGLLVARCNQNGQYPWQAPAIIRGLEQNKLTPFFLTAWEREDYERKQRGEPERGPR